MLPIFHGRERPIANQFRVVEVDDFYFLQLLQVLEADVGDAGVREIDAAQVGHFGQAFQAGVGDPGGPEVGFYDVAGGVADEFAGFGGGKAAENSGHG